MLGAADLEPFPRLPLLAGFLHLRAAQLLIQLSLPNTAVILKCEQDIERGQFAQLLVVVPLLRFQHHLVRLAPARHDVDVQRLEKGYHLSDAARARGTSLLLMCIVSVCDRAIKVEGAPLRAA